MSRPVRRWPVLLAAGLAFILLCGLGVWQLQRLNQKLALIHAVETRIAAEPLPLAEAVKAFEAAPLDAEYIHIKAEGTYVPGPALRKVSVHETGPGYELLSPFKSTDGVFVLVSRGTVDAESKDSDLPPPEGHLTIEGVLRRHDSGRGMFDPENDVKSNLWIWWDVPAMLAASGAPAGTQTAPFILQLVPSPGLPPKPLVQPARVELRNNHLGYAITWFGLAAALAGVTSAFLLRRNMSGQP